MPFATLVPPSAAARSPPCRLANSNGMVVGCLWNISAQLNSSEYAQHQAKGAYMFSSLRLNAIKLRIHLHYTTVQYNFGSSILIHRPGSVHDAELYTYQAKVFVFSLLLRWVFLGGIGSSFDRGEGALPPTTTTAATSTSIIGISLLSWSLLAHSGLPSLLRCL